MITIPVEETYDLADMLERIEFLERSNSVLFILFIALAGVLLAFLFVNLFFGSRR